MFMNAMLIPCMMPCDIRWRLMPTKSELGPFVSNLTYKLPVVSIGPIVLGGSQRFLGWRSRIQNDTSK